MSDFVIDQLGRKLEFTHPAQRIVSLVPSQTELLFDLGLREEIVGITKFCIFPKDQCRQKTKIGGTKQVNFAAIRALEPDLIIGNKEENAQADIEKLALEYPVWMSDIFTLEDALAMITQIGGLVGRNETAQIMAQQIEQGFAQLSIPAKPIRTAYFIWQDPYMVAAGDTFIDEMLARFGGLNVFADKKRYPIISMADLQAAQPEQILLSSEPYPFKAKHIAAFQQACPQAEVRLVDGTLYSWYGSRLLKSLSEIRGN